MAKKEFRPLFGLSGKRWLQVDAVSTFAITAVTLRKAAQGIGKHGLFGYGKSKKLEKINLGLKNKQWDYIDAAATALWAFTLLHGAIDAYEEVYLIPNNKQLLPGKGIVYRTFDQLQEQNVF